MGHSKYYFLTEEELEKHIGFLETLTDDQFDGLEFLIIDCFSDFLSLRKCNKCGVSPCFCRWK